MIEFIPGWRPDLEHKNETAFNRLLCAMAQSDEKLPDEVLYPQLPIENQFAIGSCQGNALAKVLECDHLIDNGVYVRLSRRFAYLATQKNDGLLGGDNGSTISGGAVTAAKWGICQEVDFPYWQSNERYSPEIPDSVWPVAAKHKVRAQCDIADWDSMHRFIGTRQGGVTFGWNWTEGMANYRGTPNVVTRYSQIGGQSLGGHAMCVIEYVTEGCQPVPVIRNSHSESWGNKGTMRIDPDLFFQIVRQSGYGAKGMTGLPAFKTRKFKAFKAEDLGY